VRSAENGTRGIGKYFAAVRPKRSRRARKKRGIVSQNNPTRKS
jgi:hypothetical protein